MRSDPENKNLHVYVFPNTLFCTYIDLQKAFDTTGHSQLCKTGLCGSMG